MTPTNTLVHTLLSANANSARNLLSWSHHKRDVHTCIYYGGCCSPSSAESFDAVTSLACTPEIGCAPRCRCGFARGSFRTRYNATRPESSSCGNGFAMTRGERRILRKQFRYRSRTNESFNVTAVVRTDRAGISMVSRGNSCAMINKQACIVYCAEAVRWTLKRIDENI